ncbi:hypothetical protein [Bradyrhizobium sp. AZCC 1721]|uniref:hypothetical protein n=1 Tax=Bradyrhizobium sp. AZCC 1721 TaxID=3117016 RepID=UPI002FEF65B2
MLKWPRRILAVVAILIALTVLLPLAYIEGTCRPAASTSTSIAPAVTLPAIDEPGYRRKLNNTFFTFPEWYIVYSFEDFGRFLDRSSESRFNYLGHIFGFWRSFCTITKANGRILASNNYVTIARSDDADFVGRLYAAGALLVLDAEQAGGCSGLPPKRFTAQL